MDKERINAPFNEIVEMLYKMGCKKLSIIKNTKKGRLHINIYPVGNSKTDVKIHHDIYLGTSQYGHYSKSNDPEAKKFLSDLKKNINEI